MSTVFLGGALVAAAVTLFILQPILSGLHASLDRAEDELTDTEARKRVALLALRSTLLLEGSAPMLCGHHAGRAVSDGAGCDCSARAVEKGWGSPAPM